MQIPGLPECGLDDRDGVQPAHMLKAVPGGASAPHGLQLEDEAVGLLVVGAGDVAAPEPLCIGGKRGLGDRGWLGRDTAALREGGRPRVKAA